MARGHRGRRSSAVVVVCLAMSVGCAGTFGASSAPPKRPEPIASRCQDAVSRYRSATDVIERNQRYSDADPECQDAMDAVTHPWTGQNVPEYDGPSPLAVVAGGVLGTVVVFVVAAQYDDRH